GSSTSSHSPEALSTHLPRINMRSFLGAVASSRILVTAGIVISLASSVAAFSRAPLSRARSIDRVESFCEVSADVGYPSLGFSLTDSLGFCRQLQNGRLLALTQCCQERDPAIRKFQRIVMRHDLVFVDLPKDRCLMVDYFIAPNYQTRR